MPFSEKSVLHWNPVCISCLITNSEDGNSYVHIWFCEIQLYSEVIRSYKVSTSLITYPPCLIQSSLIRTSFSIYQSHSHSFYTLISITAEMDWPKISEHWLVLPLFKVASLHQVNPLLSKMLFKRRIILECYLYMQMSVDQPLMMENRIHLIIIMFFHLRHVVCLSNVHPRGNHVSSTAAITEPK